MTQTDFFRTEGGQRQVGGQAPVLFTDRGWRTSEARRTASTRGLKVPFFVCYEVSETTSELLSQNSQIRPATVAAIDYFTSV